MTDLSRPPLITLHGLMLAAGLEPTATRAVKHTPHEPRLAKMMPWLVKEHPSLFRVYQQLQSKKVSSSFKRAKYIASFLPFGRDRAVFTGLYEVRGHTPISHDDFWSVPENLKLGELGYDGMSQGTTADFFDLTETTHLSEWKGRLIVGWEPGRNMVRLVRETSIPVEAILLEDCLAAEMPSWDDLVLDWAELAILPASWQTQLSQWRGIYYIFDASLNQGYVGLAAGRENLLGRWRGYARSGHGGNARLKSCSPANLKFSILELVSPTLPRDELEAVEASWKRRLHTRDPHGLNLN